MFVLKCGGAAEVEVFEVCGAMQELKHFKELVSDTGSLVQYAGTHHNPWA